MTPPPLSGEDARGRGGLSEAAKELRAAGTRTSSDVLVRLLGNPAKTLLACQLILVILIAAMWNIGQLNSDFVVLVQADSRASLRQDAFTHAWTRSSFKPPVLNDDRLGNGEARPKLYQSIVHLIYHSEDEESLLSDKKLYAIEYFESRLKSLSGWSNLCGGLASPTLASSSNDTDDNGTRIAVAADEDGKVGRYAGCNPGETFVDYLWPEFLPTGVRNNSELHGYGNEPLALNGRGSHQLPVKIAVGMLTSDSRDVYPRLERFFPQDFEVSDGTGIPETDLLHSQFLFASSVGSGEPGAFATAAEAAEAHEEAIAQELHSVLHSVDMGLEAQGIRSFYYSESLDAADLSFELVNDCLFVIGPGLFIGLLLRLSTASTPLAFLGLFFIAESMLLSFFMFKAFCGLEDIGILTVIWRFLAPAISAQQLCLLTDAWRKSAEISASAREDPLAYASPDGPAPAGESDPAAVAASRLHWVWCFTGASCSSAALCASCSFLLALGSRFFHLRELGLLLGLHVFLSFGLQMLMYPFAILFIERLTGPLGGAPAATAVKVASVVPSAPSDSAGAAGAEEVSETGGLVGSRFRRLCIKTFTDQLVRQHRRIIVVFAIVMVVAVICIAVLTKVDSSVPMAFPDDHNQVAVQEYRKRFATMDEATATSPAAHDAWMCDVTSPPEADEVGECVDKDTDCPLFAATSDYCVEWPHEAFDLCRRSCGMCGYCAVRRCDMAQRVLAAEAIEDQPCTCYEEGTVDSPNTPSPWPQGNSNVTVKAMVIGLGPADSGNATGGWAAFQPGFESLVRALLPSAGADSEQLLSYLGGSASGTDGQALPQRDLVQQHWRSGTVASWSTFETPALQVLTGTGSEEQRDVRLFCYCNGVSPCEATGLRRGSVQLTDANPASAPSSASSTASSAPADDDEGGDGAVRRRLAGVGEGSLDAEGFLSPKAEARAIRALAPAATGAALRPSRRRLDAAAEGGGEGSQLVTVVWGLEVRDLGPFECFVKTAVEQRWSFDPLFEPADVWAQRSMMRLAEQLPDRLRATPAYGTSWLHRYEEWLREQYDESFPSRQFQSTIQEFLKQQPDSGQFFLRQGGQVRAVRVDFRLLDLREDSGTEAILWAMHAWDEYIAERNHEANLQVNSAWHTSKLWVIAEARQAIIDSSAYLLCLPLVIGLIALTLTLGDILFAIQVLVSIVFMMTTMVFATVLFQWQLGAFEVVALFVFAAQAFTFSLHVCGAYARAPDSCGRIGFWRPHSLDFAAVDRDAEDARGARSGAQQEERVRRTRYALSATGRGLLSVSFALAVSGIFLLFCTLQFFTRVGGALLMLSVLSLLYGYVLLPSVMLLCGPVAGPRWRQASGAGAGAGAGAGEAAGGGKGGVDAEGSEDGEF